MRVGSQELKCTFWGGLLIYIYMQSFFMLNKFFDADLHFILPPESRTAPCTWLVGRKCCWQWSGREGWCPDTLGPKQNTLKSDFILNSFISILGTYFISSLLGEGLLSPLPPLLPLPSLSSSSPSLITSSPSKAETEF